MVFDSGEISLDYTKLEDTVALFYNPLINRFMDEDGEVVFSIFDLVTPNDVYLFRHYQKDIIVPHRQLKNVGVELIYPGEGDCECCANYYECYPEEDEEL